MTRSGTILAAFCALAFAGRGWACASCGSGSDDPLILYPSQNWRFLLGLARTSGFRTVTSDGSLGRENAPASRETLTLAMGKSIRPDAFATFTLPLLRNQGHGKARRGTGDPSLALRWTLVPQDVTLWWVPQVQFMLSHRFVLGRPIQEATDANRLDVFGQGFPETRIGIDVFHGMSAVKMGFAHALLFPGERTYAGSALAPGLGVRTTLTVGYGQTNLGKILVGIVHETRSERRQGGEVIEDSGTIENSVFLTVDAEFGVADMLRASFVRRSAFGDNRNGSRSDTFSLAWLRSL